MKRLVLPALLAALPLAPLSQAEDVATWVEPTTGIHFIARPEGCFTMGNPDALQWESGDHQLERLGYSGLPFADEAPTHTVCLSKHWIAQHEVSADQWEAIMQTPPPVGSGSQPAGGITWLEAQQFVHKLSAQHPSAGFHFRLPTEAEWEYSCRQGFSAPMLKMPQLAAFAWFGFNRNWVDNSVPIGSLEPDRLGLHDMLGNQWEWVEDAYSEEAYQWHGRQNPVTRDNNTQKKVIRGGSFRSPAPDIRCDSRSEYSQSQSLAQIGLRLVRSDVP